MVAGGQADLGCVGVDQAASNGMSSLVQDILQDAPVRVHARSEDSGGLTALMSAAKAGYADDVRALLQGSDANVKARDRGRGWTALALAAADGHEAVVAALLAWPAVVVNCKSHDGETPLMLAAERGHAGVVRLLLEARADCNAMSVEDGQTALMKAVSKGHACVVGEILERGSVDINAQRRIGRKERRERTSLELMIVGGETALMLAVGGQHVRIVETLLKRGADVGIKSSRGAFVLALERENWGIAKVLMEAGRVDLLGALMWGVQTRAYSAVRFLIGVGANVNEDSVFGTSLSMAGSALAKDVASLLVSRGAEIQGPFVRAAGRGLVDSMKLLHDEGAEVDEPTGDGTVALLAAVKNGHKAAVEYLLSVGADVNVRDKTQKNYTALIHAVHGKKPDIVLVLIKNGVEIHAECSSNQTALHHAMNLKLKEVEQLLISAGAVPWKLGFNAKACPL